MTDDKAAIADVFTTMLHSIDTLDWDVFRASFTAQIAMDYTSLWGGEPDTIAVDDLVTAWSQLAHGYDGTQHLTGPIVVTELTETSATCTTTLRAYHHVVEDAGAATWMTAGRYVVTLQHTADGWKVNGITFHIAYEEGERRLVDVARERSLAGRGGRVTAA